MVSSTMSAWAVSGEGCREVTAMVVARRRFASVKHSTGSREAPEWLIAMATADEGKRLAITTWM
jgi:hypothetical protein